MDGPAGVDALLRVEEQLQAEPGGAQVLEGAPVILKKQGIVAGYPHALLWMVSATIPRIGRFFGY